MYTKTKQTNSLQILLIIMQIIHICLIQKTR
nr:MAG TPA: hypothetical protein [Caudoviricetes sp.]